MNSAFQRAVLLPLLALTTANGILAQGQASKGMGQSLSPSAPKDPEFESSLAREKQLLARPAAVRVARLDEAGVPQAEMEFHFGSKVLPTDEDRLLALANAFTFDTDKEQALDAKAPEASTIERGRNVILSGSEPTESLPVATFFDPERDMLVVFRPLRLDLSCSAFTAINYTSYSNYTTQSFYWNFYSDMMMAAVGPNRLSNGDPDLYLYYWNGSWYPLLASSIAASTLDTVWGLNTGCFSPFWRLRVYVFSPGPFTVRATGFNAN